MTTHSGRQPIQGRHGGHRRGAPGGEKRLFRLGLLTAATLGVVGTAAGAAQAVAAGGGFSSDKGGIAIADNETFALSNTQSPSTFRDSFTIHQYGDVFAASARNDATAESVGCTTASPCRAVSLSFQIITMAGANIHLNAVNLGNATNEHCAGCQTVAGAYQFVVDTPVAFSLDAAAEAKLAAIHSELNALSSSSLSAADVQSKADALALQVSAVLKTAVADAAKSSGPHAATATASTSGPTVTVFRDFQHH
jgi:hypothetical protein